MTNTAMMATAVGSLLLTAAVSYQYLSHRVDGKCQAKEFLKFKPDYYSLLVAIAGFFVSMYVFLHGFLGSEEGFMRAMMNAGVMLWLSVVGYIDARERIIPNSLIGIGLAFWLVLILIDIFVGGTGWKSVLLFSAIGGIACGGLLLLIALLVKSALGMGDVKLFFTLGLLYGLTDTYGVLLFSVISMGIVSIVLLLAKKVTVKSTIPMAPFVILGFFLSILAGM